METRLTADLALSFGASFSLDVALEAREGETIVLLGPNGAGKTTILHLVAGLLSPDRGRVVLGGDVLCDTATGVDLPPEARRVGFLYQDFALFPHMSVRANIAYGPLARGVGRAEAASDVSRWLDRLEIAHLADRSVLALSGGERQRVALARALASGARVLLLDEPFAALDATARSGVRGELRAFLERLGLPAVVVTHDPLDAFVLGDRLAVIEGGRVVQVGTEEDLLAHPRSPFVADLVGLNFFRGEVAAGPGLKEARVGATVFHVLADTLSGRVHLAFAPSEVALVAAPSAGSQQNAFPARVESILSLPDRLRVVLDAGVRLAADVTREAGRAMGLAPGVRVWALVKATSIRVYP